jgi:hypothetical protein
MARKTVLLSDHSGAEIPEGKGATVRITFRDARKGVRELDLTDEERRNSADARSRGAAGARNRPASRVRLRQRCSPRGVP